VAGNDLAVAFEKARYCYELIAFTLGQIPFDLKTILVYDNANKQLHAR